MSSQIEFLRGPKVRLHFTADDWQLYNGESLEQDQERDFTAEELNQRIADEVAQATYRRDTRAWRVLSEPQFSRWGANDSEGHRVLERILDQVYSTGD